jgi:hypothetical protein
MICPFCKEEGLRSKVFGGGGTTILDYCPPFYDEDGEYHVHDCNISTTYYNCSNGHRWVKRGHPGCPCKTCDYREEFEVKKL